MNALIVGDFNTPLPGVYLRNRYREQQTSKNIVESNKISQLDLVHIYRPLHQTMTNYSVFSSSQGTFTETTF
jgi:hypothetical protein